MRVIEATPNQHKIGMMRKMATGTVHAEGAYPERNGKDDVPYNLVSKLFSYEK